MTQQYDNSNSGALFKNKKKQEGDKRPEYTGSINVNGHDYWISAWLKTSRQGERFMSLAVQLKDGQPMDAPSAFGNNPAAARPPLKDEMEDEIPHMGGPKAPF